MRLWSSVWARDASCAVPWEWTEYALWKIVYGCTPLELEVILAERDWSDIQTDMQCYEFDQRRQSR